MILIRVSGSMTLIPALYLFHPATPSYNPLSPSARSLEAFLHVHHRLGLYVFSYSSEAISASAAKKIQQD